MVCIQSRVSDYTRSVRCSAGQHGDPDLSNYTNISVDLTLLLYILSSVIVRNDVFKIYTEMSFWSELDLLRVSVRFVSLGFSLISVYISRLR